MGSRAPLRRAAAHRVQAPQLKPLNLNGKRPPSPLAPRGLFPFKSVVSPPLLPPVLTGHVSSLPPVLTGHVSSLPPVVLAPRGLFPFKSVVSQPSAAAAEPFPAGAPPARAPAAPRAPHDPVFCAQRMPARSTAQRTQGSSGPRSHRPPPSRTKWTRRVPHPVLI